MNVTSVKPRIWIQELSNGLFRPSMVTVSTALIVCFLPILCCLIFINEDFFISDYHLYFAADDYDFPTFVSSEALQMSKSKNKSKFVIAGASSTRVSVRKEKLAELMGSSTPVFKLCTGRQSFWETAKILDLIPDGSEGYVVIGVGPSRFARPQEDLLKIPKRPRFAFNTDAFDMELKLNGIEAATRFGNFFLDNQKFFIVRLKFFFRNILFGPPSPKLKYLGQDRADKDIQVDISKKVSARFEVYDQNFPYNKQVLERIILRLKDKTKMNIILLEHPIDPHFVNNYMGADFYSDHKKRARALAKEHDITYWNITDMIGVSKNDFYDWTHFRSIELANKYTETLAMLIHKHDATN